VAFAVIALLANGKDLSTGEIAKLIGRSVPRTSNILGFCDLPNSYAIRPLETGVLTIDFAAVSDPENSYKLPRIINLVDHSVIADPNSPLTNTGYPFHTFQPFNRFAPFKVLRIERNSPAGSASALMRETIRWKRGVGRDFRSRSTLRSIRTSYTSRSL
jgi:hypothetical protein